MKKIICRILVVAVVVLIALVCLSRKEGKPIATTIRNIDFSNVTESDDIIETSFSTNSKKLENYIKCFEGTKSSLLYNGKVIISDVNDLKLGNKDLKSYIVAYSLPVNLTRVVQSGVLVNYTTLEFEEEDSRLQTIEALFKEEKVDLTIKDLEKLSSKLSKGEQDVIYKDENRYVTLSRIGDTYKLIGILTNEDNNNDDAIYVTDDSYELLVDKLFKGIQDVVIDYTSSFNFKTGTPARTGDFTTIEIDSKNSLAYRILAPDITEDSLFTIEVEHLGDKKKLKVVGDSLLKLLDETFVSGITYDELVTYSRSLEELNTYIENAFKEESIEVNKELVSRLKGISKHYNFIKPYAYKLSMSERDGRTIIKFEAELHKVEDK